MDRPEFPEPARLEKLARGPVAIEALWDGDSDGWMLDVYAILEGGSASHPRFTSVHLVCIRGRGGDMRIFNGQVPPYPEAQTAQEIGRIVTTRWGVPFHFPAPDVPDDSQPRWWSDK